MIYLITIGLILIYVVGWSLTFRLGYKHCTKYIFNSAKTCLVEYDKNNNDSISFMGIVYDYNSSTYKYLKELDNGNSLIINKRILTEQLNELKSKLYDSQNTDRNELDYINGKIDFIESIFDSAERAKNISDMNEI